MHLIHKFRSLLTLLLACCPLLAAWPQATKEIAVSHGHPYTDHISLKDDSRDMDLMVKFAFDEPTNQLTVSLISYRPLFVFPTDTPCKQAVRRRKINPDKLPFVVDAEPGSKYILSKDYWKALPKPRGKHTFKKWIEGTGLSPLPTECKMVNDYVEQSFTILHDADAVGVVLRDVMMMEQEATARPGQKVYDVVWGNDINTDYFVRIERNPCFGLDEQIKAADNLLTSVTAAYNNLHSRYGSGTVDSRASLDNFKEMKQLLQEQFPARADSSACPDLQEKWDSYNRYVKAIAALSVSVKAAASGTQGGGHASGGKALAAQAPNAGYILTLARQLDNAVARWLATRDATERADIKHQCADIISLTQATIGKQKGATPAMQHAIKTFHQAVAYYHSVVR